MEVIRKMRANELPEMTEQLMKHFKIDRQGTYGLVETYCRYGVEYEYSISVGDVDFKERYIEVAPADFVVRTGFLSVMLSVAVYAHEAIPFAICTIAKFKELFPESVIELEYEGDYYLENVEGDEFALAVPSVIAFLKRLTEEA